MKIMYSEYDNLVLQLNFWLQQINENILLAAARLKRSS